MVVGHTRLYLYSLLDDVFCRVIVPFPLSMRSSNPARTKTEREEGRGGLELAAQNGRKPEPLSAGLACSASRSADHLLNGNAEDANSAKGSRECGIARLMFLLTPKSEKRQHLEIGLDDEALGDVHGSGAWPG